MLATLGSGGEARVVKALDRQHDRFVALKIRPVRDAAAREELLGEARVLLALPPHPGAAARARGLLRRRRATSWRWTGSTAPTSRRCWPSAGAPGSRRRACWPTSRRRPRRSRTCTRSRRRSIHGDVKPGNLILDHGRPDQARRLRPVLGAERAAAARGDAGLSRPGAGRRRARRRARATSTRSPRPRSRC